MSAVPIANRTRKVKNIKTGGTTEADLEYKKR